VDVDDADDTTQEDNRECRGLPEYNARPRLQGSGSKEPPLKAELLRDKRRLIAIAPAMPSLVR
jgi:hypothetical protein